MQEYQGGAGGEGRRTGRCSRTTWILLELRRPKCIKITIRQKTTKRSQVLNPGVAHQGSAGGSGQSAAS